MNFLGDNTLPCPDVMLAGTFLSGWCVDAAVAIARNLLAAEPGALAVVSTPAAIFPVPSPMANTCVWPLAVVCFTKAAACSMVLAE